MPYSKILACTGAALAALLGSVFVWTNRDYARISQTVPNLAIDSYVGETNPSFIDKLQCVLMHWHTRWTRKIRSQPYRLIAKDDPRFQGLKRTRAARKSESSTKTDKKKPPFVIGTIRMGYGHFRLAFAVASYATSHSALTEERDIYFHDIASIGDEEASLVDDGESVYSFGSQVMTELPNPIERFLSKMTSSGGTNALRLQVQTAALMMPLMSGLDKDCPIISTHPLVGAIAVQAGFPNVINLVVDNHPQWFVVVPGALNLVQGPKLYRELMKLGVPDAELQFVGHYNPRNIVDSIPQATQKRIERAEKQQPLRLLIPVGGAGAQESFLTELVKECAPLVKDGKLELLLNAGDHSHMKAAFQQQLEESKLQYQSILDLDSRSSFIDRLEQGLGPATPVTLFAFNNAVGAVSTTDQLVPYSDVLVCKPSEMAFFAIPKLMIRRVGDHEKASAVRAAEMGDGTLEAETVAEVMAEIDQFLKNPGDLIVMNKSIQKNNEIGMYDGVKRAVEKAIARSN